MSRGSCARTRRNSVAASSSRAGAHQHDAEVVAGRRVLRIDDQRPLELPHRFARQALVAIQEPEIVVDLRIELVAREQRAIARLRRGEVAGAMVIERQLEQFGRRDVRSPRGRGPAPSKGLRPAAAAARTGRRAARLAGRPAGTRGLAGRLIDGRPRRRQRPDQAAAGGGGTVRPPAESTAAAPRPRARAARTGAGRRLPRADRLLRPPRRLARPQPPRHADREHDAAPPARAAAWPGWVRASSGSRASPGPRRRARSAPRCSAAPRARAWRRSESKSRLMRGAVDHASEQPRRLLAHPREHRRPRRRQIEARARHGAPSPASRAGPVPSRRRAARDRRAD